MRFIKIYGNIFNEGYIRIIFSFMPAFSNAVIAAFLGLLKINVNKCNEINDI